MQTLQQELGSSAHNLDPVTHPVMQELMADPVTAYAEEVRVLRQRVALLEAELAATKAAPATVHVDRAPTQPGSTPVASEFSTAVQPAVFAVDAAQSAAVAPQTQTPQTQTAHTDDAVSAEPVPNPGFAQAWSAEEGDSSFEERVAERAFFQATTIDEASRNWLLTK